MRYAKFYTIIMLVVMLVNIGKYQLPYIEYSLFKDYIVKNLCVQRNEENNCCQGHCHLEKQIQAVNEAEEQAPDNSDGQRQINPQIDDYTENDLLYVSENRSIEMQLALFEKHNYYKNIYLKVPSQPPKRLILTEL